MALLKYMQAIACIPNPFNTQIIANSLKNGQHSCILIKEDDIIRYVINATSHTKALHIKGKQYLSESYSFEEKNLNYTNIKEIRMLEEIEVQYINEILYGNYVIKGYHLLFNEDIKYNFKKQDANRDIYIDKSFDLEYLSRKKVHKDVNLMLEKFCKQNSLKPVPYENPLDFANYLGLTSCNKIHQKLEENGAFKLFGRKITSEEYQLKYNIVKNTMPKIENEMFDKMFNFLRKMRESED